MKCFALHEENLFEGEQKMYPSVLPSIPSGEMVVIYTSCETRHERGRGSTAGQELKALRQFAYAFELKVLGEFKDPSKERGFRIGFDRMMTFLRHHSECRVILVMTPERLSKRPLDWFELTDLGVTVYVVGEALSRLSVHDTGFPHRPGGRVS